MAKEIKQYSYVITYGEDGEKKTIRKATSAFRAINALCEQYGWNDNIHQIDADTRGLDWAEAFVDKTGGINYTMRMVAVRMNRYKVSYYDNKGNKRHQIRYAADAVDAIEKMCEQYGWFFRKIEMYDADTRGDEWAICAVERYLWVESSMDAEIIKA